jgi:hypothetical protein
MRMAGHREVAGLLFVSRRDAEPQRERERNKERKRSGDNDAGSRVWLIFFFSLFFSFCVSAALREALL